ncbi:protein of unknown function [Microbacterium azadirachtae]|jgi:hypothetical protein|uniref:DUF4386 domain-containing protein n=1 Tax=Microbacterium azadirachtae TaxID=582680 RepID=A0A1I6HS85_9MICO|nr:DUF4386 domain-containing protein [Microbacterium azadirachtae]SFR57341.1 protein of unknown function [Microbacterium azadirachtae]
MTTSPRTLARTAGILYLVTHVTSVLAVPAYAGGWIRAGVTLEFALAIACAGTGVLLWRLLYAHGEARALSFAVLRAVEAAVILAGTLPMLAAAWTRGSDHASSAVATDLHAAAFLVGQGLVIGVNTVILGTLLWDSGILPRTLAALGVAGGGLVFASDLAQLWGVIPPNGIVAGVAAAPIFAFELWLAVLLLIGRPWAAHG